MLGSIKRELDAVFDDLAGGPFCGQPPTSAAFCKARKKIKPGLFRELIKDLARQFFLLHPEAAIDRLVAIDGSIITLPDTPKIRSYYGPLRKRPGMQGPPQARLSLCYEVNSGVPLDARLTTIKTGERKLAKRHFRLLRPGDLVVMDMGYFGHDMLLELLSSDLDFVMRVPPESSGQIKDFVASEQQSATLSVVDGSRHDRVRAVRIDLPDGTVEVLLTNLTSKRYDLDFFREIYHRRWDIETFFDHLKHGTELENFSGKCPHTVQQEVYARILTCSLASMLTYSLRPALRRATATHQHTWNFAVQDVLAVMRRAMVRLLLGPLHSLRDLWGRLADRLLTCRSPSRPGRTFARTFKLRPSRYPSNRKRI